MSEESKGLTPAEKEGADIRVDERFDNDEIKFEPLFDDEVMPESDLKDEDEKPSTEEKPADSEPKDEKESKPTDEKDSKEEPEGDQDKSEEDPGEKQDKSSEESKETPKDEPPPKGYVPIEALHESRSNEKTLKQHIASLERNIELLQSQPKQVVEKKSETPDEFKDFKVLSDAEWKELVAEDVEEALIYSRQLDKYNKHQSEKQREKELEIAQMQQVETAIQKSVQKIADSIPGIYDEGNELQQNLYNFGVDSGFDGNFLTVMSNPATRIIPIGEDGKPIGKEYPLGDGAASLVAMIHKFYQAEKSADPEKLRSEITKEVEVKLRDEISKEIMAKIKNNEDLGTFRSISDAPGGDKEEPHMKKHFSENDFYNMSDEEARRALGG